MASPEKSRTAPIPAKRLEPFTESKGLTHMVPQATCSPARQCWIRAWERARTEKLIPSRTANRAIWMVKGYFVEATGAGWSDLVCTGPAGRAHRVCKHAAVVAKAIAIGVLPVRGSERGQEVAPAAAFTLQPSTRLDLPSALDAVFA